MNKTEIAQLLTIASGFDRRQVDQVTVESWWLVPEIRDADYQDAVAAVVSHFGSGSKEYLTVGIVVSATQQSARQTKELIAVDVRSARARKLVPFDWPETKPVSNQVRALLAKFRDEAQETARQDLADPQATGPQVCVEHGNPPSCPYCVTKKDNQ